MVELGEPVAAIPLLEKALFTNATLRHQTEFIVADASFALARALRATGGDKARARRLAEVALKRYAPLQVREREAVKAARLLRLPESR